jgi:hypothetical protein
VRALPSRYHGLKVSCHRPEFVPGPVAEAGRGLTDDASVDEMFEDLGL